MMVVAPFKAQGIDKVVVLNFSSICYSFDFWYSSLVITETPLFFSFSMILSQEPRLPTLTPEEEARDFK